MSTVFANEGRLTVAKPIDNAMKRLTHLFWIVAVMGVGLYGQSKVILDTDPSYDPDDAGCMAMLHTLASQGECEILAIVNSTNQKQSPIAIGAINAFYNRGAIPVGDYKGYAAKVDSPKDNYDAYLATRYPSEIDDWTEATDAVDLYREILASADDRSITVVIIGTMHNFAALLKSSACAFSSLDGKALVEAKVEQVVTMGGNFIDGFGYDRTNWGGAYQLCGYTSWSCLNAERNAMCRFVIENCRAPFVASGWEVGCGDYYNANYGTVFTGQGLKKLPSDHIIRRSYEQHFKTRGGEDKIRRHSNDQCALHYAILGEGDNYVAYTNGVIDLSETGICRWTETLDGNQGYIQKSRAPEKIAEEIEALMMGDVPELDASPPLTPTGLRVDASGTLRWNPSTDPTEGSWVVAYSLYADGEFVRQMRGTQFPAIADLSGQSVSLTAINASGSESDFSSELAIP